MHRVLLFGGLLATAAAGPAAGQVTLDRFAFTAAGGVSSSPSLRLEVLAGDVAVGPSLDGPRILWHGFWAPLFGPAVSVPDRAVAAFLEPPVPNPALGFARVRFGVPRAGFVEVAVHDVTGRTVRSLVSGRLETGGHEVAWDLRDGHGHPVGAGVYWVRVASETFRAARRLVVH
jgi:hypothetical protein